MLKVLRLNRINSIIAVIFVIAVTFALHALNLGQASTLVLIPLGFMYFFMMRFSRIKTILTLKPISWYLIFLLFAIISILYSIDSDVAIVTQKKMLIVFLFTLAVFSYALNSIKTVKAIYVANVIVLFLLIGYVLRIGIDRTSGERIEESVLNANTYGYYVFTGLFSLFILYSCRRGYKQKVIYLILTVLGCIFSFWLILASASRGAFIIISLLIIGNIFIITFPSKSGMFRKVIVSIIFLISIFYLASFVSDNYLKDSYLLQRFNDLEERETPRQFHARKAIEVGSDNPLLGIGAGNYAVVPKAIEQGSFSHNTFTEVFANFGLIGVFMYLAMLFTMCLKIRKNFKTNNNRIRVINYQILLFFFIFVIYNTLYVVYLSNIFMHFLFVIYAHLLLIEREVKLEGKQRIHLSNGK